MAVEPTQPTFGIPVNAFRPILRELVTEALAVIREAETRVPESGPLAYSEAEAARLLGLATHVLRDERRRGRIAASQIVGRRIRYTKQDLMNYLIERRVD